MVSPRFAICIDNSEYPVALELHKLSSVVPDEEAVLDGDLRIIDESGSDYLYPAAYFILVDFPPDTTRALDRAYQRTAQLA